MANIDVGNMTTGELLRETAADLRTLIAKEMQAARLEIRGEFAQAKRALFLGGVALCAAGVATIGLLFTIAQLLRGRAALEEWIAFLVTTAIFGCVGVVAGFVALRQAREVSVVPEKSLQAAQRDLRAIARDVGA